MNRQTMQVYQVRDWDTHYENNKSRERDECSFVCVPNKQHGLGFLRLMAEKDGAAIYGIFNLILGACSRQRRPRMGWLTDDGRANGVPWTVEDLSMRWRRSAGEVARALEVLCSDKIAWLERVELAAGASDVGGARVVPGECPRAAPERREGKEEKEGCGEPQAASPPPDPLRIPFPDFPVIGSSGATWRLTEAHVAELSATFPGVNVPGECRKAHGWVKANMGRRKTARGMPKFVFGWIERAQNQGRGRNGDGRPHQPTPRVAAAVREDN